MSRPANLSSQLQPPRPHPYPSPLLGWLAQGVLEGSGEHLSPVLSCNLASSRPQPPKQTNSGGSVRQLQHSCAPWRKSFLHAPQRAGNLVDAGADLGGRERPSPSRNAPPAEWMCARPAVGSEADESHRRLISVPTPDPRPVICPGGMAQRSIQEQTPQRKLPSRLACPFSPSLCHKGGNFQGATPNSYHFLQLQRRGASRQTLGAEAPEPPSGCLRAGTLAPNRPHLIPRSPATPKEVLRRG